MNPSVRKYLLSFILTWAYMVVYAQNNTCTIKGTVADSGGNPVMFASVCILKNGNIVTGTLTDTLGTFMLKDRFAGDYSLRVTSIGYEEFFKNIHVNKGVLELGQILLPQKTTQLEGIVVASDAPTKRMTTELTRINPAATMTSATGSVLEVLRGSSAVFVDNNGHVTIKGNSNVLLLIDGVPTTVDGLGSIPVANVQNIDIISSPEAKYDAEGSGGIISIVSKQQTPDAFTAMASINFGWNHFVNANAAVNYNFGKWGIRINYNGKRENDWIESVLHRQIIKTGSSLDQHIEAEKETTSHNLGLNVGYKLSRKDMFVIDVKAGFPRVNNLQTMQNHYAYDGRRNQKFRQTDISFDREMIEGSLTYRHQFEPGRRELNLMASLSDINGHRPSYYYELMETSSQLQPVQRSESGGHPHILALQLDYMMPWGKGKLETGVKMTCRINDIDHKMFEHDVINDTWTLSVPLSNDLRHREYIPAAYVLYSARPSDKLSYKAGIRMEYSRVTLKGKKDHLDEASNCYFVAPNMMLDYHVNESWRLSLGISRRISRPTYPQLNPYINLIDNQTYETGNVRLKPEKTNKLDLGYSFNGKSLKVNGNAYFNYAQDYINQITYLDITSTQNAQVETLVMTYVNGSNDLKTGIEHNIVWSISRWLSIDLGTNVFFTKSYADWQGTKIRNHGWSANGNTSMNIKPRKGMNIQLQYFLTTPQYFPQFTTKTDHSCNIGVRQQLPKMGINLSVLLTDAFNTRRWDISSDNPVYSLVNTSRNRSRIFWLGISWNFHSYKQLGGQKKQEEDRSIIRLGQ